jgi:tetratricopeptide (TPR) repeat protein
MSRRQHAAVSQARPTDGREHPLMRARTQVQEAERFRLAGKLDRARSTCASMLAQYPDYVAALQTMGLILADQSRYDQALSYLQRASMLHPHDARILTALSGVYLKLGSPISAARTLEHALVLSPDDANIHATLGEIYREEKEYELARDAFETALRLDPKFSAAQIGLAQVLMNIGELGDAAAILEEKVNNGSRSVGVLYMLSQLPANLVSLDLIELLDGLKTSEGKLTAGEFRVHRGFATAAALDKAGRFEEAWVQLCEVRRFGSGESRKIYQQIRRRHASLLDAIAKSPRNVPDVPNQSADYPMSLFIAGPSRSGKTTLERLVGTLAGVKRGCENPIIENATRFAFQSAGFPTYSSLLELPQGAGDLFRQAYIEELRKRSGPARVLTNTLPGRCEDAWKAAAEIPRSRFIFVKRDIDDTSIRIFMRNYKTGNHYASDLRDIRDYIQWTHQMMDRTAELMPDRCRILTYEEIVADPNNARSIAARLCDLEPGDEPIPAIGDDRGCAAPYVERIQAMLASG